MAGKREKLDLLSEQLRQIGLQDGVNQTKVSGVACFKSSVTQSKCPNLYEPLICLIAQGEKVCHVGSEVYRYRSGNFFINFLPLPVQTEVVDASEQTPFLSAALGINLVRLAEIILQIERLQSDVDVVEHKPLDASCVVVGEADADLIDAFNRLLKVSSSATEAAILGDAIVDEIYFRILTGEHGFALRELLNQYGHIQPVSKAVNYIHANLNKSIQVEQLASLSNMSKTAFYNAFKRLMHLPPNQYIKGIKLQRAQALLKQGMQANEASFHVGYSSFSQFSREYKRFFGFSPSQTAAA